MNLSDAKISRAKLLHWTGGAKPWYSNGLYQKYWDKYQLFKVPKEISVEWRDKMAAKKDKGKGSTGGKSKKGGRHGREDRKRRDRKKRH
jgi:hypothetical protein